MWWNLSRIKLGGAYLLNLLANTIEFVENISQDDKNDKLWMFLLKTIVLLQWKMNFEGRSWGLKKKFDLEDHEPFETVKYTCDWKL